MNATPTSTLTTLANPSSTRLWWITPNGSVQTAVQFHSPVSSPGSASLNKDQWCISIVSGYQSASIYSETTAIYLTDTDLRVFWFAPDDTLVCARAVSTAVEKTDWRFVDKVPVVRVCKTVGDGGTYLRKRLVAAVLGEKKIGVWFIDVNGAVKNLVWSD